MEFEPLTLAALRERLSQLTRERWEIVAAAQQVIEDANRTYDREALKLHRQIRELEPPDENTPVTPVTRNTRPRRKREIAFSLEGTEGWTQEEIDHYRELSIRRQRG